MTKKINLEQNTVRQYKVSANEQDNTSEIEWQRWRASYVMKRKKIFKEILGTGEKGQT
jgi:hypothetical protein